MFEYPLVRPKLCDSFVKVSIENIGHALFVFCRWIYFFELSRVIKSQQHWPDSNQIAIPDLTWQLSQLYGILYGLDDDLSSISGISTADHPRWEDVYYNLSPKVNDSIIRVRYDIKLVLCNGLGLKRSLRLSASLFGLFSPRIFAYQGRWKKYRVAETKCKLSLTAILCLWRVSKANRQIIWVLSINIYTGK